MITVAFIVAGIFLLAGFDDVILPILSLLLLISVVAVVFSVLTLLLIARLYLPRPVKDTVGFFHPFAESGGGGERVLWTAIQALQDHKPHINILIYCSPNSTPEHLCITASQQFGLRIRPNFKCIPLYNRETLLPGYYPRLTMAFQALASVRVALQGLRIVLPEVYVDTTGWSFPYPFVRFAAAKVAAYVHYPTISQDMLNRVIHRQSLLHNSNCDSGGVTTATGGGGGRGAVNNNNSDDIYDDYDGRDLHALLMQEEESGGLVGSLFIMIKAAYYYVFAFVYSITGMAANVVMCNSNWTRDRIIQSWWKMGRRRKGRKKRRGNHISVEEEEEEEEEDALPMLVYPPCDTKALQALPLDRKLKRLFIISVAQFRPEKNHVLQLRAFAAARREVSSLKGVGVGGGGGGETMHMQLPTDNNNNKNTIGAAALEEDDEDDDNHNASTIAHSVLSTHLILVGGCRDHEDQARVEQLKAMASTLGIADHVEFKLNVSRDQIKALLQEAIAGLHTMEDEHFGISIVEYMAAGVVPIVHDSGGPREDIVVPNIPCHFSYNNSGSDGGRKRHKDLIIPRMTDQCITNSNGYGYGYSNGYGGGGDTKAPFVNNIGGVGYRCRTENEYRDAIIQVVSMDQVDRLKIAEAARKKAECYSDEIFSDKFIQCISPLLQ